MERLCLNYAEDVWNDDAVRIVAEQGRKAPGDVKYMASKTLAERGAQFTNAIAGGQDS